MRAVNLRSNKILQFLTGGAGLPTNTGGRKTVVVVVVIIVSYLIIIALLFCVLISIVAVYQLYLLISCNCLILCVSQMFACRGLTVLTVYSVFSYDFIHNVPEMLYSPVG